MPNAKSLPPVSPSPLVVALAYDGLCLFEFGIAAEVFGLPRPELEPGWYRFAIANVDGQEIRTTAGLRMDCDGGLDLLAEAGTIIIPGWRGAEAPVPDDLVLALQAAHRRGARILTICSGVFVLAASGLLQGKKATTHWRYTDKLAAAFPDLEIVPDVLYVDEGSILTSAGSAAGIDLCLHLVRRDYGPEVANTVARRLVVPPHRDGGQAQFLARTVPTTHEEGRFNALFTHMQAHLDQSHPIAALATRAGMSQRTLLRRFEDATGTTPARWLLRQRLVRSQELLETTTLAMDEIADQCGFGSAANLRHHFRQELKTSPTAYRRRFSVLPDAGSEPHAKIL